MANVNNLVVAFISCPLWHIATKLRFLWVLFFIYYCNHTQMQFLVKMTATKVERDKSRIYFVSNECKHPFKESSSSSMNNKFSICEGLHQLPKQHSSLFCDAHHWQLFLEQKTDWCIRVQTIRQGGWCNELLKQAATYRPPFRYTCLPFLFLFLQFITFSILFTVAINTALIVFM